MGDTSQLYTTVKNLMGVDHVFGYLPPHGKLLKANQSYTVPGDLTTRIVSTRAHSGRRGFRSMERDLIEGRFAIESTPRPIFFDAAAPSAVPNPTVAIVLAAGGAGSAWAGTTGSYFFVYSYVNAYGETAAPAATRASLTLTNATTKAQITIPAQAGAVSANVYASTTSGSEVFLVNILAASFGSATALSVTNFPTQAALPGSNTATLPAPAFQPLVNVTGGGSTGGSLQAGAYFAKYTWTNANGETSVSPETQQFTIVAGNIPSMTLQPAPNGATGLKIYLTAAAGGTGTETLYDAVPVPVTTVSSNLAGYLQASTATNQEVPNSLYLFTKAQATGAAMPGSNTATVSAPTFTPVVTTLASGVPSVSPPLSNLVPYLSPGMQGDVIYGALQYSGQLQAGTYLAKITYTNAGGETTPSPETSAFTVVAGQIPLVQVTPPNRFPEGPSLLPAGVTGVNIYLTAAGGASNSETLYQSGVTSALAMLTAPTGNKPAPQSNTTIGHTIRSMRVNADTLGTVDPSWGSYQGPA